MKCQTGSAKRLGPLPGVIVVAAVELSHFN